MHAPVTHAILLLTIPVSCSSPEPGAYSDAEGRFSVHVPSGWTMQSEGSDALRAGIGHWAQASEPNGPKAGFPSTITIGMIEVERDTTPVQFVGRFTKMMLGQAEQVTMGQSGFTKIRGRSAYRWTLRHAMHGQAEAIMAYAILDGRWAYVLSCQSGEKRFGELSAICSKMANTFDLHNTWTEFGHALKSLL